MGRWETDMSYLVTTPAEVQAAAQNLAGIRSMLAVSSVSAAAPTTAARLLTKHASVGLVEKYAWLLATAKAAHRPAVISESNSGSCGGRPGVSDQPVAGVWAARYVLAAMLAGWAQVRFHTAGTSYDALGFEADGTVAIHPLGHALLFLHRWIPVGSRALRK